MSQERPEAGRAERNRRLALHAFAEFAKGNVDILRTALHEDFIEHSPGNPSGRDAFTEFMKNGPVTGARLELKRVIADDDHVVMHYNMIKPGETLGTAVVDIWRMRDGLITEHWDVLQPVPDPAETPNGMF
ncbi:nuclear transport factor 2 family protein [Actinomadura sp. HBU206391]|uniref:nuclear transport factor 2 family protein n=1 Tax=Actinomadura sp. HBU206391 TaxID=2731692 RepID=UPI0016507BD3|nr:nuclear transport factor 2 family protein [Actinomadura sp. HBU206391]MBC6458831.1 nuclear transport factor 2 family protein [Actinomadura sp. HBU206391]